MMRANICAVEDEFDIKIFENGSKMMPQLMILGHIFCPTIHRFPVCKRTIPVFKDRGATAEYKHHGGLLYLSKNSIVKKPCYV